MLKVTGEATVRYEVKLPMSEADYEVLSESKAKQLIENALFAVTSKVLDVDINVWDYGEEDAE